MDDRELLELAARAAGMDDAKYTYDPHEYGECMWSEALFDECGTEYWNPLTNDGDRYRLARTLGISLDFTDCYAWKRLTNGDLIQEFWGGDTGVDEAHAIVRAAAALAQEMK